MRGIKCENGNHSNAMSCWNHKGEYK